MAYFAQVNENNIVTNVIRVENSVIEVDGQKSEEKGIEFCKSLYGQDTNWVQTSYGSRNGIYYNVDAITGVMTVGDQSKLLRKTCAENGYTYDPINDWFMPPQPYPSWTFNYETWRWDPPVARVTNLAENEHAYWNEQTQSWDIVTQ